MSPSRRRLLLIDADPVLRDILCEHLAQAGFAVTAVDAAAARIHAAEADIAVVDGNPNGEEAENLCRQLKADRPFLPVAVLGPLPRGGMADAVLPKPLRLSAVVSTLEDLVSRRQEKAPLRIGPWLFDSTRRALQADDGRQIRLTDKETAILNCLGGAEGAVSRDRLLSEVWGYSAQVSTHTLETHIYRLRRKIEADPARPLLVTEAGGYRLAY